MKLIGIALTFLSIGEVWAKNFTFWILHNSDIHGRFEETARNTGTCRDKTETSNNKQKGCVGGCARMAYQIRKYRKLAKEKVDSPVVYLNAGDCFVGTQWYSVHKWRICAEFMNALKPDAMSLGQHEFDNGIYNLARFINNVTFPIIAANLDLKKQPQLKLIKNSTVVQIDGRKIGIVGHINPDTQLLSLTSRVQFFDIIESLKNETETLNKAGIKIIIILGNSGYEMDQKIAMEVPLADVVVGGDTFQWNGSPPDLEEPYDRYPKIIKQKSGKKVPVVQAYAYTKYLGKLKVTFNEQGDLVEFKGQPEFLDTQVPQDPEILELLERYRGAVVKAKSTVIGKSHVSLDGSKCTEGECNLGNMITNAFVEYVSSQYPVGDGWSQYPIAVLNGGSIKATIDTSRNGSIRRGDLLKILPSDNRIVSLQITGKQLIKTLETGLRSKGEFLQVAGLQVKYDPTKPSYSRVVSVKARCGLCRIPKYKSVHKKRVYSVITTDFLAGGGDRHFALKNGTNKKTQDLSDVDIIEYYLSKKQLVYPEIEGRIISEPGTKIKSILVKSKSFRNLPSSLTVLSFIFMLY